MQQGTLSRDGFPACPAPDLLPHPPALPARTHHPALRADLDPRVLLSQRVPTHTHRLLMLALMRHRIQRHQMPRLPAALIPAPVMHVMPIRDHPHEQLIRRPMHRHHQRPNAQPRVTVTPITHPPRQRPAGLPASGHLLRAEPQAFLQRGTDKTHPHLRCASPPQPRIVPPAERTSHHLPPTTDHRTHRDNTHSGYSTWSIRHSTRVISERRTTPWV